jgi:hypothetical protein
LQRATLKRRAAIRAQRDDLGLAWLSSLAGRAMNRFVHRVIMSVLLVAALVLIWNVLGSR